MQQPELAAHLLGDYHAENHVPGNGKLKVGMACHIFPFQAFSAPKIRGLPPRLATRARCSPIQARLWRRQRRTVPYKKVEAVLCRLARSMVPLPLNPFIYHT